MFGNETVVVSGSYLNVVRMSEIKYLSNDNFHALDADEYAESKELY